MPAKRCPWAVDVSFWSKNAKENVLIWIVTAQVSNQQVIRPQLLYREPAVVSCFDQAITDIMKNALIPPRSWISGACAVLVLVGWVCCN